MWNEAMGIVIIYIGPRIFTFSLQVRKLLIIDRSKLESNNNNNHTSVLKGYILVWGSSDIAARHCTAVSRIT